MVSDAGTRDEWLQSDQQHGFVPVDRDAMSQCIPTLHSQQVELPHVQMLWRRRRAHGQKRMDSAATSRHHMARCWPPKCRCEGQQLRFIPQHTHAHTTTHLLSSPFLRRHDAPVKQLLQRVVNVTLNVQWIPASINSTVPAPSPNDNTPACTPTQPLGFLPGTSAEAHSVLVREQRSRLTSAPTIILAALHDIWPSMGALDSA